VHVITGQVKKKKRKKEKEKQEKKKNSMPVRFNDQGNCIFEWLWFLKQKRGKGIRSSN
jgi:hypothetical protein